MEGMTDGLKHWIGRVLSRHESFNSRLKAFNVLGHRFRHGSSTQNKLELHQMCTEAVACLVQIDMDNGHPIFSV